MKAFAILGPLEVRVGEDALVLGGVRNQSILAALLLGANRVVSVERLVEAAWGDTPPGSARAQVQNRVGSLRRLLWTRHPGGELIATIASGYRLSLGDWDFDLHQFDEMVARADVLMSAGRLTEASSALSAALGLWRGPVLEGLHTPPLQGAAVAVEERRLNTLERRIQLDLDLGRHARLVPELTALSAEHPYRETMHALLMLALYGSGRQAEALHTYHRVRKMLAEQVAVDPGEQLRMLHEAMLRGEYVPTLALTAGAALPSTSASAIVPRELPADTAAFTGRQSELLELDRLLPDPTRSDTPVVVAAAVGSAGVGKTALAVRWAHRTAHRFPDGQLYIDLRGYAPAPPMRPIEALGVLLCSLGVRPERVPLDVAGATAMYRSLLSGRRVLVVLDNARSAEEVRPLLPGGPGGLVLVTSRDRLTGLAARDGAHRLSLSVFTPDEAGTLLARLLGGDRVRNEPDAAVELAKACGYLPLALCIAVAKLAYRADRRIADLMTELRTPNKLAALAADDDHETGVRGSFDLSYETVSPAAQHLFRLLGFTPGDDFSTTTAAALYGGGLAEVQRLLSQLAAAHLIEEHAVGRFALHGLLRQYASDRATAQLSASERAEAVNRLYNWYSTAKDGAVAELRPHMRRPPNSIGDRTGPHPGANARGERPDAEAGLAERRYFEPNKPLLRLSRPGGDVRAAQTTESNTTSVGSRIGSDSSGASTGAWPGHGRMSMKRNL
ncbi:AfsR/SARP family transcriptional regulator [Micromonospora zamorensis]|uniref:AfsR/SARP family transcriptional regulator n=1 Tax=Micromonospora zamorensis TaxID=709883 RepID=UPI00379649CD